jgi:hypothetical protein
MAGAEPVRPAMTSISGLMPIGSFLRGPGLSGAPKG